MANPRVLIDGGHLYTDNPDINEAMHALYNFNEQGVITTIRPDHIIHSIFERFLQPFLLSTMNGGFTPEDIRGLIVNIVLYDALLDETFGLTRDIPEYHPDLLLELIGTARRAIVNDSNDSDIFADELYNVRIDQTHGHGEASSHILLWASERLLPYFANELGMMFVQDARTIEGNTYLHCYLSSAVFRILNPDFVDELLINEFRLNDQNNAGETPLHMIVYASDDPFAHLTDEEIRANPKSREVKRYNRFYQSMVHVFQDPDAKMDIKNRIGRTVLELVHQKEYPQYPQYDWNNDPSNQVNYPNEQHMGYVRKTALKAYHNAEGIRAVEKARKKIVKAKLNEKLQKTLGSNITKIILNMAGTPQEYEQAAIERKQKSNITRYKMLTNQELLNRSSSGGRTHKKRTHKTRTHKTRTHKTRTHKKRVHKKRQTRR